MSRFKTSYSDDFERCSIINDGPSLVIPDLTFSIQELAQKFTINQMLLYNKEAQALFDVKDDKVQDSDFDRACVNLPKNYDLVDAYNNTKKFTEIRKKLKKDLSDIRKRHQDAIAKSVLDKQAE